ncbi:MAG: RluA family pseudouridine synthase [Candidatus Moranbacteria bacterium]|nr:RluA family pseudouridine synthase [Candidatus Moranbacteria bacterium]
MQTLHTTIADQGLRIDVFLKKHLPQYTRSTLIKHIKNGFVLVNAKQSKPSYRLNGNENISFNFPQEENTSLRANFSLSLPVIFQNDDFIIINKPSGIQVHPSSTEKEKTVVNWLVAQYPDISSVGDDPMRPGIVHRLDKDTSGIMIIAKNTSSFSELKKLFSQRNIQKSYVAITHSTPSPEKGSISLPIARSRSFRKQTIVQEGTRYKGVSREALTEYKLLFSSYSKEFHLTYSVIQAFPKTGRMHQIRIHLSHIHCPIIGDALYKKKEFPNPPEIKRFLLHAYSLEFSLFGKPYTFTLKPPQDYAHFLGDKNLFENS